MFERNYENLAAAIVGQACEDYCYAVRHKNKYKKYKDTKTTEAKKYKKAVKTMKDCRDFFHNEIYLYLENPPEPDTLIKRLRYVANRPQQYQIVRFLKNTTGEEDI